MGGYLNIKGVRVLYHFKGLLSPRSFGGKAFKLFWFCLQGGLKCSKCPLLYSLKLIVEGFFKRVESFTVNI